MVSKIWPIHYGMDGFIRINLIDVVKGSFNFTFLTLYINKTCYFLFHVETLRLKQTKSRDRIR